MKFSLIIGLDALITQLGSAVVGESFCLGLLLEATMRDPTHDKIMWKRTVKQGFRTQQAH